MKISISFFILVFVAIGVSGQESVNLPKNEKNKEQIVVNHKMIERFNSCEYAEETLNYSDILKSYSFDEVKSIIHGYNNDEISLTKTEIENYIEEEYRQQGFVELISEERTDQFQ